MYPFFNNSFQLGMQTCQIAIQQIANLSAIVWREKKTNQTHTHTIKSYTIWRIAHIITINVQNENYACINKRVKEEKRKKQQHCATLKTGTMEASQINFILARFWSKIKMLRCDKNDFFFVSNYNLYRKISSKLFFPFVKITNHVIIF